MNSIKDFLKATAFFAINGFITILFCAIMAVSACLAGKFCLNIGLSEQVVRLIGGSIALAELLIYDILLQQKIIDKIAGITIHK